MQFAQRIAIVAATAAAAVGLMAGAANAAPAGQHQPAGGLTAVTRINNVGTVPGYAGNWASSRVVRTATLSGGALVAPSDCGLSTGNCYAYTASVSDAGNFWAIRGALTPNQYHRGTRIESNVSGWLTGSTKFGTFYSPVVANSGLVPDRFTNGFYTTDWPEFFFPYGTKLTGLNANPWRFQYSAWTSCGFQRWTDASYNDFGNLRWDGNIMGCRPHHHRR